MKVTPGKTLQSTLRLLLYMVTESQKLTDSIKKLLRRPCERKEEILQKSKESTVMLL